MYPAIRFLSFFEVTPVRASTDSLLFVKLVVNLLGNLSTSSRAVLFIFSVRTFPKLLLALHLPRVFLSSQSFLVTLFHLPRCFYYLRHPKP